MKISKILLKAATEYLLVDSGMYSTHTEGSPFSCTAVRIAANKGRGPDPATPTMMFLVSLGVNCFSHYQFSEFEADARRDQQRFTEASQGARFLWLMFAYEVALSEGL